jgi:hypothetical protein
MIAAMADESSSRDELTAARAAAERLVRTVEHDGSSFTARPDREQWRDGERLLDEVRHAAENLTTQLNLSQNLDPP